MCTGRANGNGTRLNAAELIYVRRPRVASSTINRQCVDDVTVTLHAGSAFVGRYGTVYSNVPLDTVGRGVDHGWFGGSDPLKICRKGQSMFYPLKCHIVSFKTVVG